MDFQTSSTFAQLIYIPRSLGRQDSCWVKFKTARDEASKRVQVVVREGVVGERKSSDARPDVERLLNTSMTYSKRWTSTRIDERVNCSVLLGTAAKPPKRKFRRVNWAAIRPYTREISPINFGTMPR